MERWNRLHPSSHRAARTLLQALEGAEGPIIAATDYVKAVADQIAPRLGGRRCFAGSGRLRSQRGSRSSAPLLRGERGSHRRGSPVRPGAPGQVRGRGRAAQAIKELGLDPEGLGPFDPLRTGGIGEAARRELRGMAAAQPQGGAFTPGPASAVRPSRQALILRRRRTQHRDSLGRSG